MSVAYARTPILVERQDRRASRTAYEDVVLVNGEAMNGRDISATGLAVFVKPMLAAGDVVRVTLAGTPGQPDEIATSARVSRIEASAEGFVVGLQFIE